MRFNLGLGCGFAFGPRLVGLGVEVGLVEFGLWTELALNLGVASKLGLQQELA